MNGKDFILMQKQDLETYTGKDKPALLDVVALMECIVNTVPGADIEHSKSAKECYKKMYDEAREKAFSGTYCYHPSESEKFVRDYLGLSDDLSKLTVLQSTAKKVNLSDFF